MRTGALLQGGVGAVARGRRAWRELAVADAYEVSDYKRVLIRLASGRDAWAYVVA